MMVVFIVVIFMKDILKERVHLHMVMVIYIMDGFLVVKKLERVPSHGQMVIFTRVGVSIFLFLFIVSLILLFLFCFLSCGRVVRDAHVLQKNEKWRQTLTHRHRPPFFPSLFFFSFSLRGVS